MNAVIVGAGYVGGCTAAVIASQCKNMKITVIDVDRNKIDMWNSDDLPIKEPGLEQLVFESRGKNLFFTTDTTVVAESSIAFIAVNTPTKSCGIAYDLSLYEAAAEMISLNAHNDMIVIEKSTVPVGTAEKIALIMSEKSRYKFYVINNPEFLAEGTAIRDLLYPDRILIGGNHIQSMNILKDIYRKWVPDEKIIMMNSWSSELSKLTANAMLAQRVSSINSISAICEKVNANITDVSFAIGSDKRIGHHFLTASVGFGGSCFKKDLLGLIYLCESFDLTEVANYWRGVLSINEYQKKRFCKMILNEMGGTLRGKKICILGITFKKNTADTRESAALDIINFLTTEGAAVHFYDSTYTTNKEILSAVPHKSAYGASFGCEAVVLATEWDEFRELDWIKIYQNMTKPTYVFDGRGIINVAELRYIGFQVFSIGRK